MSYYHNYVQVHTTKTPNNDLNYLATPVLHTVLCLHRQHCKTLKNVYKCLSTSCCHDTNKTRNYLKRLAIFLTHFIPVACLPKCFVFRARIFSKDLVEAVVVAMGSFKILAAVLQDICTRNVTNTHEAPDKHLFFYFRNKCIHSRPWTRQTKGIRDEKPIRHRLSLPVLGH